MAVERFPLTEFSTIASSSSSRVITGEAVERLFGALLLPEEETTAFGSSNTGILIVAAKSSLGAGLRYLEVLLPTEALVDGDKRGRLSVSLMGFHLLGVETFDRKGLKDEEVVCGPLRVPLAVAVPLGTKGLPPLFALAIFFLQMTGRPLLGVI